MKKKIAVPVNESGDLDSHFGHCSYFAIYEAEDSQILSDKMIQPPPHEPGVLPQWLGELKVTDVLAGGMGNRALQLFDRYNIKVYTGAPVMPVKELVNGFLNNSVQFNVNHCNH